MSIAYLRQSLKLIQHTGKEDVTIILGIRKRLIAVFLMSLLITGAGRVCQPQEPIPEFDVFIEGYAFKPTEITTSVGNTVTWYNADPDIQTVTAQEGASNSGDLARSDEFSYTFEEIGTFEYYCIHHPYMMGKIIVE